MWAVHHSHPIPFPATCAETGLRGTLLSKPGQRRLSNSSMHPATGWALALVLATTLTLLDAQTTYVVWSQDVQHIVPL